MIMTRLTAVAATLLALAACGETARPSGNAAAERGAHTAAAAAMDASFDKELGGGAAEKPKPAADKPKPADKPAQPAAAKPKADKPAEAVVAKGRPDWVDQPPSEPGKLYAVGSAPRGKRDDARTKAKQEIAAQLRVSVKATTTTSESETTRIAANGGRVGKAVQSFRNDAQVQVERDLSNTSIIKEAEDVREVFALAMLDRAAWAVSLRREIEQVDAKLTALRDQAAAAGSGLYQAARALRSVGPLAAKRDILVADLILAEPQSQVPACPVDIGTVVEQCRKQMAAVSIRLEGAEDAVFASRLQDAMSRVGLTVTEKAAPVVLRLALRQSPRKLPNTWTRINVSGSATVVNPETGKIAGSLQVDESGTDVDENQARSKMLDAVSKSLAASIDEQLLDLLGQ